MMRAGIEIEVFKETPEKIHVFPRESRRGRARWAMWVKADGSAVLFVGNEQIVLPKNSSDKAKGLVKGLDMKRNEETGQIEFVKNDFIKV